METTETITREALNLPATIGDERIEQALAVAELQAAGYAPGEKEALIVRIKELLKKQNAVLVAHYYTSDDLQQLADETGGHVADSLEMARFGNQHPATTLVVAGVRFMGETAKILNPEKRVLMPDPEATCSLDLDCPPELFSRFCDEHPDHTVVVYANTCAEVKARADWVVTSGIALPIVRYLAGEEEKILWAPDRYLGSYVRSQTGCEMLLWPGSCIVHEKFKAGGIRQLKLQYPDAAVLVHPESPEDVIALADAVGSTTAIINAAKKMDAQRFIVATESGIFYKMKEAAPDKIFMEAPNAGIGATCQSCARCPWMAMNGLRNLAATLESDRNEILVQKEIRSQAIVSIQRMLDFARERDISMKNKGNA